jgi:hypothetical protein
MEPIHTVPLEGLREGIETILEKRDGVEYVQKLLEEADRLFGTGHPHVTDFWEGFEMINNAGGYQLVRIPPHPPELNDINGATVMGDLFAFGAKPGTVYITPQRSFGPPTPEFVRISKGVYAYRALHETFHLARQGRYSDKQLAITACSLANVPAPNFSDAAIFAWSGHFDIFLDAHCPKD